jgi:hypothetical protein
LSREIDDLACWRKEMPSTESKPTRKSQPKPNQKSGVAKQIKKRKADLTDDELNKVSGGVPPHKAYVDIT